MAARPGRDVAATAAPAGVGHGLHHSHKDVVSRLNRAAGQIKTVVAMIEGQRSCLDIAQQLHAVEMAVGAAKKVLIKDHIDHCLDVATEDSRSARRAAVEEFKQITKYL